MIDDCGVGLIMLGQVVVYMRARRRRESDIFPKISTKTAVPHGQDRRGRCAIKSLTVLSPRYPRMPSATAGSESSNPWRSANRMPSVDQWAMKRRSFTAPVLSWWQVNSAVLVFGSVPRVMWLRRRGRDVLCATTFHTTHPLTLNSSTCRRRRGSSDEPRPCP